MMTSPVVAPPAVVPAALVRSGAVMLMFVELFIC